MSMKNLCRESRSTSSSSILSAAAMIALSRFGKPSRLKNQRLNSIAKNLWNASTTRRTWIKMPLTRNLALGFLLIKACLLSSEGPTSRLMENCSCFRLASGRKMQNRTRSTVPSSTAKISLIGLPSWFPHMASQRLSVNFAQSYSWRRTRRQGCSSRATTWCTRLPLLRQCLFTAHKKCSHFTVWETIITLLLLISPGEAQKCLLFLHPTATARSLSSKRTSWAWSMSLLAIWRHRWKCRNTFQFRNPLWWRVSNSVWSTARQRRA